MPKKREVFSSSGKKRVNFFDGRLLSADDFQKEQDYHRALVWQSNRAALGCGVIRGLDVSCSGGQLTVTAGLAVCPTGQILELTMPSSFDLSEGLWDLTIEISDQLCDPLPVTAGSSDPTFGSIQEIVKLAVVESSGGRQKVSTSGVWLATIEVLKGIGRVVRTHTKDR
jgi:hypothetical protein